MEAEKVCHDNLSFFGTCSLTGIWIGRYKLTPDSYCFIRNNIKESSSAEKEKSTYDEKGCKGVGVGPEALVEERDAKVKKNPKGKVMESGALLFLEIGKDGGKQVKGDGADMISLMPVFSSMSAFNPVFLDT